MLNSAHCADTLVNDLVAHIRSSAAGDKTVIAILSDHLLIRGEVQQQPEAMVRRNPFILLDPERPMSTIQTYPQLSLHRAFPDSDQADMLYETWAGYHYAAIFDGPLRDTFFVGLRLDSARRGPAIRSSCCGA